MSRAHDEAMGDEPSMPDRPRRRSFTADYKLAILDEYDRCTGDGDKGALLRQEGLYTSHIVECDAPGTAVGSPASARKSGQRRTTRSPPSSPDEKESERAEAELAKTRLVVEIQGKASELLGRLLAESDEENRQQR